MRLNLVKFWFKKTNFTAVSLFMEISKLSVFFLLFLSKLCFSQVYSVKGIVEDKNSQAIAFANVLLSDAKDENSIKGVVTNENGNFIIENLNEGSYIIKITYLGFKTFTTELRLNKSIDFNTIILEETTEVLDGVTVVAKQPTIKRFVDRTVFNVENSTLSNNNILDVLKLTPGVLINNDEIIVKSGTPTVYMNDKRVYLSTKEVVQLLQGSTANTVKFIEVITSPPAKYDADGGSVINIVTSKNIIAGYNGTIFGNFKQGSVFPKYAIGSSHFFKTKKLNTHLNYNISPRKDFKNINEFINFKDNNNNVFSSWETVYNKTEQTADQNINADIDYEINKKNNLSFSANILVAPNQNSKTKTSSNTLVFGANKALDSTFNSMNRLVEESFNLAFTINYQHQFNKDGEQMSLSSHYTNYDFSNFQNVNTDYFLPNSSMSFRENEFQTFSSQKINIYTSQADYELPIDKQAGFEAGLKVSFISSTNILNQFDIDATGIQSQDLENSDTFLYDEDIYAAYLSYTKDWESWSLKSGLRMEYTNTEGNSLQTNEVTNNDYFNFFPNIHLSKKIKAGNEVYINYNKRIYRPSYSQLNPFKYFFNDNTFLSGDPNLIPQVDDQIVLGYTFKDDYNFELYYRNEANPILLVVFQDNDNNLIKYANTNIDSSFSYGLDFSLYKRLLSNYNMSVVTSMFYYENKFKGLETGDALFESNKWTYYLQLINSFSFLKDKSLNLDVTYFFISPWAEGPSIIGTRSSLDIALRKTLWNNRASISLGVIDAFNNNNFTETSQFFNQDIKLKHRNETRLFTFGFNYKFGNYRLSNTKKEIDINERSRIQNKN